MLFELQSFRIKVFQASLSPSQERLQIAVVITQLLLHTVGMNSGIWLWRPRMGMLTWEFMEPRLLLEPGSAKKNETIQTRRRHGNGSTDIKIYNN